MTTDHGERAENAVESICRQSFLADFVVRNPYFETPGGIAREAADLLLPFGETLIVFQVRSHCLPAGFDVEDPVQVGRAIRPVLKAVDQIKTFLRALDVGGMTVVKNLRGISLPFDCAEPKRIIGVVVSDLVVGDSGEANPSFEVYAGLGAVRGVVVHVFQARDFEHVAEEIDTIPDLIRYLDARAELKRRQILAPVVHERDLVALFIANWGTVEKCLRGEVSLLSIEAGLSDSLREEATDLFRVRAERRRLSRVLVDRMLDELHTSIGQCIDVTESSSSEVASAVAGTVGTVDEYWKIALEFASLDRATRMELAELMKEKLLRADVDPKGFSYFSIRMPELGRVFAFVSSREAHDLLVERVFVLGRAAFAHHHPARAIAFGTQQMSARQRCHVFHLCDAIDSAEESALSSLAAEMFAPEARGGRDEWGNGPRTLRNPA